MPELSSEGLLFGLTEEARVGVAERTGTCLCRDDISDADRRAAELLARGLAEDAIERVRGELSKAVRHAKHLPRELAMMIAHDVESVACPFLEVTEVFSDRDWQSLILTIGRSAHIAIARRSSLTEPVALSLAEVGDTIVAETLVGNPAAPMTGAVCDTLLGRFASEIWVLDKMAAREDLVAEIVVKLTTMVSAAARDKLASTYQSRDYTNPVVSEAETAALLDAVRAAPGADMTAMAESLYAKGKLKPFMLLEAARGRDLAFLEAALAVVSRRSIAHVRSVLGRAAQDVVVDLLKSARVPEPLHGEFWDEIGAIRAEKTC